MNPLTQSKNTTILTGLIALTLGCFALAPAAQAVCQEGCLTNDNTVLGDDSLLNNTGTNNTAIGAFALGVNTTGSFNTASGFEALSTNTTGNKNTATGVIALHFNTTGNLNTATGYAALASNTTGSQNTATGWQALVNNTSGISNTATGVNALFNNTVGNSNTADGINALNGNTIGNNNTAIGFAAMVVNTSGSDNLANGVSALQNNDTGNNNTASGVSALLNNTSGNSNIALGASAGVNLTTGSNNIDIGNAGVAGESRTIRIGTRQTHRATFIAGIYGQVVPPATGTPVLIDASGRLGTMLGPIFSARRFKHDIKAMDKASESILALQPVTFHYKKELDPDGIPQFGLVAEDVEKVNSDLVSRDEQGKPYSVRYEAVNAMLLNEFLKEHAKVEQLKKDFESKIAEQQKQIEALSAQIQKVSAQIEVSKPAPQMVLNNQ
jgi:hypothetical protein